MAVGKGSLNRVSLAQKKEIVSLGLNNVIDVDVSAITFKKVSDNSKMTESVKAYGVILPVVVTETAKGLKAIDGAKRLTALKELGIPTVKAVVIKDGKTVSSELKKFEQQEKTVEKIVEKTVIKEVVVNEIHEEKFKVVKRLGEEEMPVYLL